jgi:hypothetical protein
VDNKQKIFFHYITVICFALIAGFIFGLITCSKCTSANNPAGGNNTGLLPATTSRESEYRQTINRLESLLDAKQVIIHDVEKVVYRVEYIERKSEQAVISIEASTNNQGSAIEGIIESANNIITLSKSLESDGDSGR